MPPAPNLPALLAFITGGAVSLMTLQPLLEAMAATRFHAFAAMGAFALGVVQLAAPKGTGRIARSAGSGSR
jgi:hypothetical protein